ncbi:Glucosamine-6-phosphate deaminase 1 [Corynebacterium ciconiae DSM 44920]|uniref:glucosamine-6-phosphate deaminase n=1 Tax=Corynebacterium ciconiae TaxID=227319 RepID=UPI000366E547|nr:glucosamine-6-phosphate deaminase [Corynebacterium ciconiae]WKD61449.1 Glucosamine-6-phosphate deaminase 1 [Corynebacterium ciconiae DSM 44920]
MRVIITESPAEVATIAADMIADTVRGKGEVSIGLATGSTPIATYKELIARYQAGEISFANTSVYMLDEYIGIDRADENSYYRTIRREFSEQVDIDDSRVHSPNGQASSVAAEAARYEETVRAAGVSLQLLGIGSDGHIGFNEPGSAFDSPTHRVILHPQTVRDNARFFSSIDEVPREAITQGLATIRAAEHPVLLATGESKAPAVAAMVEGPVTAHCPASILQFHPNCTVIVDSAAASQLLDREFYIAAEKQRRARTS